MKFIENIIEPAFLWLTWKAGLTDSNMRKNRIIGKLISSEGKIDFIYAFDHPDFTEALELGFEGYPELRLESKFHRNVDDIFLKRLPSRTRKDFSNFLKSIRLKDQNISTITLLGYSGAKVISDNFSIINPFVGVNKDCELLSEVAGCSQFQDTINLCQIDDKINYIEELDNKYDQNAIALYKDEKKIGYINRILAPTIKAWIINKANIDISIEKISMDHRKMIRLSVFISVKF